jgi:hypothetical protein
MELFNIQKFLEVYKDKLFSEDENRQLLVSIIKKHAGVSVPFNAITIKKNVMTIAASPIVRNELYLHKREILEAFKANGRGDICDLA